MNSVLSLPSVKFLLKFPASLSSLKFSPLLKEILKKLKLLEEMILPLNTMISSLLISKIYSLTPLSFKIIPKNYSSF
jgi:DNA polymerase III psi subunit